MVGELEGFFCLATQWCPLLMYLYLEKDTRLLRLLTREQNNGGRSSNRLRIDSLHTRMVKKTFLHPIGRQMFLAWWTLKAVI